VTGQNGIGQNGIDKKGKEFFMNFNSIYISNQKSKITDRHIEEA